MSSLIDLISLVLILILAGLNITFFIVRKRENSASILKILIIILLGIAILVFTFTSLPYLTINPDTIDSPKKSIFSNLFFYSLIFSAVMFFYSIFHSGDDIVKLEKPSFLKSRKGKVKVLRLELIIILAILLYLMKL